MKPLLALLIFLFAALLQAQPVTTGASVSGLVVMEDGRPVPGAIITATMLGEPSGDPSETRSKSAPSFLEGNFGLTGLSAGTYSLCVQVPDSTLLDPCLWSDKPPAISLRDQQIVFGISIEMKQGKRLKIRIEDPANMFDQNEGKTPGANLLVGVATANGTFLPAVVRTKAAGSRELGVIVPTGRDVDLVVNSDVYQLADERGGAIAAKQDRRQVRAEAGDTEKQVIYRITGVRSR